MLYRIDEVRVLSNYRGRNNNSIFICKGMEESRDRDDGGGVVIEGLCESLIPGLYHCVQIWRHLVLHRARSQDPSRAVLKTTKTNYRS